MPDGEPTSAPDVAATSFIRLAEAHRREGLVQDAIRICRERLQRFPESLRGRIVLGQCLLDHGSIGEASHRAAQMVIEAARAALNGVTLAEILLLIKRMIPVTQMIQTADTLRTCTWVGESAKPSIW